MILGIESSCDESALAIFDAHKGIVWETVYSQTATHAVHGGVVPELAVREHLEKFPVLRNQIPEETFEKIEKIAVTVGPGLVGSLAVGMAMGQAMALERQIPVVGVNHLRAHAWSSWLPTFEKNPQQFENFFKQSLPHLGLLVSGGNTLLYEIAYNESLKKKELNLLARTVDDAAGEAMDKVAKMMELPYPGGPLLEKLAATGDAEKFDFPVAFKESPELAFSFSGLKTAMRYRLQAMSAAEVESEKAHLAASFQRAVVEALTLMVRRALKKKNYKSLGLCGGVAQNQRVRGAMEAVAKGFSVDFLTPLGKHCGDNAAMVAWAAHIDSEGLQEVKSFEPSLKIDAIDPIFQKA